MNYIADLVYSGTITLGAFLCVKKYSVFPCDVCIYLHIEGGSEIQS